VADDELITTEDRWRLILGQERERLRPLALKAGISLDELYGAGRGEGSRSRLQGGGEAAEFLSTREWMDELEALFGREVRDEVIGRAAEAGRGGAILEVDPEAVTPSIELLQQVLSLKGGLSEDRVRRLRPLVARVVRALVEQLAIHLRPALAGSVVARPTRRRGGPLDLRRTINRNLRTVRFRQDGTPQLSPDDLIFRTRARRSIDWRVILVVDVSGSMEASVIYSALMAAILSGLPALETNFVAFSTDVIDLSQKVGDPLGLLLEVVVGGGTDIARGLRYARGLMTVPSRTLVVLVTDFEEGGPVDALLAEVRAIAESGAHPLGLAALDDLGSPRYSKAMAEQVVAAGMPVAALTPLELARWIGEKVR
jgi:Mg-chelatase subunit ChlD